MMNPLRNITDKVYSFGEALIETKRASLETEEVPVWREESLSKIETNNKSTKWISGVEREKVIEQT